MFTIKYNRTANHIDGLTIQTKSTGSDQGSHVSYYAQSACGALTRGSFATGASFETVAEVLKAATVNAAVGGRRMCKTCTKAAEAMIAAN